MPASSAASSCSRRTWLLTFSNRSIGVAAVSVMRPVWQIALRLRRFELGQDAGQVLEIGVGERREGIGRGLHSGHDLVPELLAVGGEDEQLDPPVVRVGRALDQVAVLEAI